MTKKHFIRAAEIVREETEAYHKLAVYESFVQLFREFNPRFDVERFRAACGL